MKTQIDVGKRIVQTLRYRGFIVELFDGRIRYGAGNKPSNSEREEVRANRDAVVAYLASEPPKRDRSCFGPCPKCGAFAWLTQPSLSCRRCSYVVPSLFSPFGEQRS